MIDVIASALQGLPAGAVWSLIAIALVMTYTTSRVLNLAFAAQAYAAAVCFTGLHVGAGVPRGLAGAIAVLVVSPLLGVVLERFLFRRLGRSDDLTRLVTVLGVLVAGPAIVDLIWDPAEVARPPTIAPDVDWLLRMGRIVLDIDQVITLVATALVGILLTVFLSMTSVGLRLRAVAESRRLSQLHSVDADKTAMVAWALSSCLAGLAGVLLLPDVVALDSQRYVMLLLGGLAAAAFGGLRSIPLAVAGGLALGATQGALAEVLPPGSLLANGLRPALPFVALLAALLLRPGLKDSGAVDPLADVDPPVKVKGLERSAAGRSRWVGVAAGTATVAVVALFADVFWMELASRSVALAIVLLSFTLLTGTGGMISLCQVSFLSVGGFAVARLAAEWNIDVVTGAVIGGALAAVVGALVALPALRLGGVYLGLATLAFALAFETVIVPADWVNGGEIILRVPRPIIGPFDLRDGRSWFLFLVVCLVVVGTAVRSIQRGNLGRSLAALRGSEVGLASVGVDPVGLKLVAFSVSAGIAGFGGGLLAVDRGQITTVDTVWFLGLVYLVLIATSGAASVGGAVVAGVAFFLLPELFERWDIPVAVSSALFGIGALGYVRLPNGWIPVVAGRLDEDPVAAEGAAT